MYNIKVVSKMLNMPTVTLRAWENRYNVVEPQRSASGHRLYTDENIEDLKWVKHQVHEKGMSVRQAVELLKKNKASKQNAELPLEPSIEQSSDSELEQIVDQLFQVMITGNSQKANTLLDLYFSTHNYKKMFYEIIVKLMHRVGDEWEAKRISTAQEHFVSNLIYLRFMAFYRIFPINPSLPKVMALCPSGEHHQLGLLLFTLFLREKGYDVLYLGSNTPLDGLSTFIEENQIAILCISVTIDSHYKQAKKLINELTKLHPQVSFVIGGAGIQNEGKQERVWTIGDGVEQWEKWMNCFLS